jgi:hypothetical protein
LDNHRTDAHKGEVGLYCSRLEYTYDASASRSGINTIYEKKFEVVGAQETVVYLFDMNLNFEFPMSAQMKVLLRRVDPKE